MTDSPEEEAQLEADARAYHEDQRRRSVGAWLDVSLEYLSDSLRLPNNCEILDVIGGENGTVALLVQSPDIHPDAMRVRAVFEKTWNGPRFSHWNVTAKRDPSAAADGNEL